MTSSKEFIHYFYNYIKNYTINLCFKIINIFYFLKLCYNYVKIIKNLINIF